MVALVVPHELAHASAGWLLGIRVFRIIIGKGKTVWRHQAGGCTVEIKSTPLGGLTITAPMTPRLMRTKIFLMTLAGPLVHVALAAVAIISFKKRLGSELEPRHAGLEPALTFLAANAWLFLTSVTPHKIRTPLGIQWSDGGLLIGLAFWGSQKSRESLASLYVCESRECRERKDYAAARAWLERGLGLYPDLYGLHNELGVTRLAESDFESARESFQEGLRQPNIRPEHRALVLNNIAYTDFLLDRSELLAEADRFSAEAIGLVSGLPALKGTRGSVLIALGRVEEGCALLEQAFVENETLGAKALNACALAMAMSRLGNVAAARELLDSARGLDPECVLLARAERCLAEAMTSAGG
jgi:tetratricopeptide (TPR) repeat protein